MVKADPEVMMCDMARWKEGDLLIRRGNLSLRQLAMYADYVTTTMTKESPELVYEFASSNFDSDPNRTSSCVMGNLACILLYFETKPEYSGFYRDMLRMF